MSSYLDVCKYVHTIIILFKTDLPPTTPTVTPGAATPTSVVISWNQQSSVTTYEISFQRATGSQQLGDCSSFEHSGNASVAGSITTYNLTDLQEFSTYVISVTAVNQEGRNGSVPVTVNTQMAGMYISRDIVCYVYMSVDLESLGMSVCTLRI